MPEKRKSSRSKRPSLLTKLFRPASFALASVICAALLFLSALSPAAADRTSIRGDAVGQPHDPDLPWSGTIQNAQRALRELGLYDGPVDGRLTPRFERALREYEAQYGIVGDAAGLPELLEPVKRSGQAAAIQETLERARREQIDRASTVLLQGDATRDLMQTVPENRADPTRRPDDCFVTPTAQCLLAEAIETAKSIGRDDYRNWAFRDILRTQTALGEDIGARESIRRLTDPRLKLVALREMVEELARQDRLDDAASLAETIPDPRNKAAALAVLAARYAEAKDSQRAPAQARRAVEIAAQIADMGLRVDIVTSMARALSENGLSDIGREALREARAALDGEPAGSAREAAVSVLARAFAELGAEDEASALIVELAAAEARRGAPPRASDPQRQRVSTDSADARYRVIALAETARARGAMHDFDARDAALARALAVAAAIEGPFARDYGYGRILLVQAAEGDAAAALRTAERIDDAALRSRALWSAAETLRQGGRVEGAALLERASARSAEDATSAFDRIAIACEQAIAVARMGKTDAARTLIRQALDMLPPIRIDWWRARALAVIAQAVQVADAAQR
ncbi:MAG: peptidoglycan-binding protein [Alphaproteobacteria bacterium]